MTLSNENMKVLATLLGAGQKFIFYRALLSSYARGKSIKPLLTTPRDQQRFAMYLMLMHVPPVWCRYVAPVALRTCAAQSLTVKSTGIGCFFFLKKDLPATSHSRQPLFFMLSCNDMKIKS